MISAFRMGPVNGIIQAVASPKFFEALSVDYQLFPSYVDVFLRIQGDGVVLIVSMIWRIDIHIDVLDVLNWQVDPREF